MKNIEVKRRNEQIKRTCPYCETELKFCKETSIGDKVKCPICKGHMIVAKGTANPAPSCLSFFTLFSATLWAFMAANLVIGFLSLLWN